MSLIDRLLRRRADALPGPTTVPGRAAPSLMERMDAIVNALTGLGDAGKDRSMSARPVRRENLTLDELSTLGEQSGICRRAIWLPARDSVRRGWQVLEPDGDPVDEAARALDDFGANAIVTEAVGLARWWGGCPVLLVHDDVDSRQVGWRQPVSASARLVNAIPVGRPEATPADWPTRANLARRDWDRPASWSITMSGMAGIVAHRSRVVWVPGDRRDPRYSRVSGDGYDLSILEAMWDSLRRHEQVAQSGALMASEMHQALLKIAGLAALQTEDQASLLGMRLQALNASRGAVGLMVMDEHDQYESHAQSVSGFGEVHDRMQADLAATTGIPLTVLFGHAPSGLSTDDESARRTYGALVEAEQQRRALPVLRAILDGLGYPDAMVDFAPVDSPGPLEQSQIRLADAQADAIRIQSQVLSPEHVARSRFRSTGYGHEIEPVQEEDALDLGRAAVAEALADWRADAERYTLPEAARNNARKVLRWRERHPDEIEGMTEVGWRRARQLATSETVGIETVRAMAAFNRHRQNAQVGAEFEDEPWRDAGYVAWLGWGGTTGIDWAREITGAAD